jgi:predicted metal-dependent hydrolase
VAREAGLLRVRMRRPSLEGARRLLKRWYYAQAQRWCATQASAWATSLGVTWTRLQVRDQRARWGSCSTQGALSFNYRLVMAPPAVLAYVVLHELAHRREMNHSPRFWALIAAHCPAYREAVAWLKRYGPYLGV